MQILCMRTGLITVNTYIVTNDRKEGFIVDPGGNYKRIRMELDSRGIQLKAQLLTHGHFDHFGASAALQRDGIPVYIHRSDAEKLHSSGNLASYMNAEVEELTADVLVEDGQTLEIAGFEIRILHTPGHSSGSVCYLVGDVIFSGDTLFCLSVGRTDFPGGSPAALMNSIRYKLFTLEGDYRVLPGHEEETTLEYERRHNPLVEF